MNREEFKNYIESIGFIHESNNRYLYKYYIIYISLYHYEFYDISNNIRMSYIDLRDLNLLEKVFIRELRSIKIKQLLG